MSRINNYFESLPKIAQFLWILVLSGMLLTGIIFFYISTFLLPDTGELENPKYELASMILASDGSELGKAFKKNREWLTFDQINPNLVKALVATEDVRYYRHCGIDAIGTTRAFVYLGNKGGASTITQQLAKLFFTERANSFILRSWQKLKEWVIAVEFEKRYTKEEIIAMYLNKYDFLHGGIGVSTAAKTYFGKTQDKLAVDEAAVLIGMLKNPQIYNPKSKPENAAKRKNTVLGQMLKKEYITKEEYEKLKLKKIDMANFEPEVYYTGSAPYFRAELIKWIKNLLNDSKYKKPDGTKYNIFTDGLKVYTTIDARIQAHAEEALAEHMRQLQKKLFNVWDGKDAWTYDADEGQKASRAANLAESVRQSDRFKRMREAYLSAVSARIYEMIPDARLNDADIFRLFNAESDAKYLANLYNDGVATKDQIDDYKIILKSEFWPQLKKQWQKLKKESDIAFNKQTTMKIYDYETGGEKKVKMTPLDSIKYLQMHMQLGSLVVDPKTGQIKAWVGGINHKYFQYDHVTSNRQVGSTFKPFIYSTAIIDQAMSPCTKVQDNQYCIQAGDPDFGLSSTWCPDNSDNKHTGEFMTLKEGLKQSKNSVSVFLMKQIGNVERVRSFVSNLWIDKEKIPKYPSICLGVAELSVMDMATAYTAFANDGTLSRPVFVTKIEDKDGKTIYSAVPEHKKAINPGYNYVIVDMLKYVATPIANKVKSEVAGKTGTTNDYKDGWFVGFTPELVIATWVGGDQPWVRFRNINDGQGAVMARPFFVSLLNKIESDPAIKYNVDARFAVPEEQVVELDCSKYDQLIQSDHKENTETKKDEFESDFEN